MFFMQHQCTNTARENEFMKQNQKLPTYLQLGRLGPELNKVKKCLERVQGGKGGLGVLKLLRSLRECDLTGKGVCAACFTSVCECVCCWFVHSKHGGRGGRKTAKNMARTEWRPLTHDFDTLQRSTQLTPVPQKTSNVSYRHIFHMCAWDFLHPGSSSLFGFVSLEFILC